MWVRSRAAAVVLVISALVSGCGSGGTPGAPGPPAATKNPVAGALDVLRGWDLARSAAWSAGDADALSRLYVPGSRAGRRDVALLASYAGRGLRVTGMRMQVLRARVLVETPQEIRIDVVDRLSGSAVGARGVVRRLPTGGPSRQTLTLSRARGQWLMARIS